MNGTLLSRERKEIFEKYLACQKNSSKLAFEYKSEILLKAFLNDNLAHDVSCSINKWKFFYLLKL